MGPAVLTRWPAECCLLSCAAMNGIRADRNVNINVQKREKGTRAETRKRVQYIYLEVRD